MAPSVLAVVEPSTDTEWLIHELAHRIVLVDCRHGHLGEGQLIAPFSTDQDLADTLSGIYADWETQLEIIHPGPGRVEKLLHR